jgi:hypothetical protein
MLERGLAVMLREYGNKEREPDCTISFECQELLAVLKKDIEDTKADIRKQNCP